MTDITLPPLPNILGLTSTRIEQIMRSYARDAVLAERERWRLLLSPDHVYLGDCPDVEHQDRRDAECPVCVRMGELT